MTEMAPYRVSRCYWLKNEGATYNEHVRLQHPPEI